MSAASSRVRPHALLAFAAERPGGVLAALTLGVVTVLAALAPAIASQNPFDLSSFDVLDAGLPPAWLDGSDPRFLLGTDAQGRDLFPHRLLGRLRALSPLFFPLRNSGDCAR